MNRLIPCLFALSLSCVVYAQDKPSSPPSENKPTPAPYTGQSEAQWETDAHTTDCSKAPNRFIFSDCVNLHGEVRNVALKNISAQNDANEILVAVRNMADPMIKVFLTTNQNIITLRSYPQDLDRIEAFIHSLDLPHHAYKLTYTLVTSDGGKRVGIEHYSMTVVSGQRTTMKEGSKIPVVTGTVGKDNDTQSQFQYLDIGLNFDATLTQTGPNLQLKTKVEQSSVGEPQVIAGVSEPVVRQAVIEGVATLTPGRPVNLGALDVPNSTRHLDIEVLVEPVS